MKCCCRFVVGLGFDVDLPYSFLFENLENFISPWWQQHKHTYKSKHKEHKTQHKHKLKMVKKRKKKIKKLQHDSMLLSQIQYKYLPYHTRQNSAQTYKDERLLLKV